MIATQRLKLCPWREDHAAPLALMHADQEVMDDQGGPISRSESDTKLDRYRRAYAEHGLSRWAVETSEGEFLGYAGVLPRLSRNHPLGPHYDLSWRFVRRAWGHGYATESAQAALADAFKRPRPSEVLAYASPANLRSQAVMRRLNMRRDATLDFAIDNGGAGLWRGLVWVASR